MLESAGAIIAAFVMLYLIVKIDLSNHHDERVAVAVAKKEPVPDPPSNSTAGCMVLAVIVCALGGIALLAGTLPPEVARMLLPK